MELDHLEEIKLKVEQEVGHSDQVKAKMEVVEEPEIQILFSCLILKVSSFSRKASEYF